MSLDIDSLKKRKVRKLRNVFSASAILIIFLIFFFSFFAMAGSFTPSKPAGVSLGYVDQTYEFKSYTTDPDSYWKFDWGDGTETDWIQWGDYDNYVASEHSWGSPSTYEVRVMHKNIYSDASPWSSPLTVTIEVSDDSDFDGYSNNMEESYGSDSDNASIYPDDYDGDLIPDDNSADGIFTGDLDDDNDGVLDEKEKLFGSDPKDELDVNVVTIKGEKNYFVDTNKDEKVDIFYNPQKDVYTTVTFENNNILIDFDADGEIEYVYSSSGVITEYEQPFEIPWMYVIIAVIAAVIFLIFILFKTGFISVYEEEYVVEE